MVYNVWGYKGILTLFAGNSMCVYRASKGDKGVGGGLTIFTL